MWAAKEPRIPNMGASRTFKSSFFGEGKFFSTKRPVMVFENRKFFLDGKSRQTGVSMLQKCLRRCGALTTKQKL
jgi:hypothetical protein